MSIEELKNGIAEKRKNMYIQKEAYEQSQQEYEQAVIDYNSARLGIFVGQECLYEGKPFKITKIKKAMFSEDIYIFGLVQIKNGEWGKVVNRVWYEQELYPLKASSKQV